MKKEESNYLDIVLTDMQSHVVKPRNPASPSRAISKAIKKEEPGRFFIKDFSINKKDGTFTFTFFDNNVITELQEQAKKEGKQLRLFIKKNFFMYASKDTNEYIEAHKKRAFDKANNLNKIKR